MDEAMQPLKRSLEISRCACCGDERSYRMSYPGGEAILFGFGSRCLCTECYFSYVERRASSTGSYGQVSDDDVQAKVTVITQGLYRRANRETDQGRCVRLLALGQLKHRATDERVKLVIADDLGLNPHELFPRKPCYMDGSQERKAVIMDDILRKQAANGESLRASCLAKFIYGALAVLALVVLYRAWR